MLIEPEDPARFWPPVRLHAIAPLRLLAFALAALLTALAAASSAVAKPRTGCSIHDPFGTAPQAVAAPLDASLLASYGVLRRAPTTTDQPPPINSLADQVFGLGRYDPTYIRQLAIRPGGARLFLVPGFPVHIDIPPARCLPRELRPQRPGLVAQQLERENQPVACVAATSPRTNEYGSTSFTIAQGNATVGVGAGGFTAYAPLGCPRFRDVARYESLSISGLEGVEHTGIVPDEIAALRVHFRHAATVQVPVVENVYSYKSDRARKRSCGDNCVRSPDDLNHARRAPLRSGARPRDSWSCW